MSKNKKRTSQEEPVKLDMSFEDAIRLAMKTPPIMGMDLILDQEQELRSLTGRISYSGRIVTFKQMHVDPTSENVHEYIIEVRRTAGDARVLTPIKLKEANSVAALFTPWLSEPDEDPKIRVSKSEQIFLTLRKKNPEYNSNLTYCRLAFTLGTNF